MSPTNAAAAVSRTTNPRRTPSACTRTRAMVLPSRGKSSPFPTNSTILVGHRFGDDIKLRASNRHRSRRLSRAKSPLRTSDRSRVPASGPHGLSARVIRAGRRANGEPPAGHHSLLTTYNSQPLWGGTVNRPRTHVTHRKQTTGHMQGRNFPVHFLFRFSARFSSVVRPFLSGVRKPLRDLGWWLPETVTRVETHLTRRKQTPAHASTRNVPAHLFSPLSPRNPLRQKEVRFTTLRAARILPFATGRHYTFTPRLTCCTWRKYVGLGHRSRQAYRYPGRAGRADRRQHRDSHLRSGRPQLGGVRTGSRSHAADSSRRGWRALHRSGQPRDYRAADHRLLFLPADDCGVSRGRRIVHGGHGEPRRLPRPARGGGADARLHPGCRRGNFGGSGRAGFRRAAAAPVCCS